MAISTIHKSNTHQRMELLPFVIITGVQFILFLQAVGLMVDCWQTNR